MSDAEAPRNVLAEALLQLDGMRFKTDPDHPMRTTAEALLRILEARGYRVEKPAVFACDCCTDGVHKRADFA